MAYSIKYLGGSPVTISYAEMVACIALAGWPESEWAMAAAIAGAESSLNINIYNTYKSGHFGCFQISKSAHPDYFSGMSNANAWVEPVGNAKYALGLKTARGNWKDWESYTTGTYLANLPAATLAVGKVKAQLKKGVPIAGSVQAKSYGPYSRQQVLLSYLTKGTNSVTNRVEVLQLGAAVDAVGNLVSDAATTTAQDTVKSGSAVVTAVNPWSEFLSSLSSPSTWMRITYGITGVALVIGGLALIVSRQPAVQSATKIAAKGALL